jgi:triacylglycerol lipase
MNLPSRVKKVLLAVTAIAGFAVSTNANAFCWFWDKGYTKTKYPIVLAHGAFGFNNALGIVDYWYEIADELRSCSGAKVYTTQVSPSNSTEYRGEQLLAQVQQILAATGAQKVNLIGHSMGGLDIRYVAKVRPDLVASVTSVGSPHKGTAIFEQFAPFLNDPNALGGLINAMIPVFNNALQTVYELLTGTKVGSVDMQAAVNAQRPSVQNAWNVNYPAGVPASACGEGNAVETINGQSIRFYSWTGDNPVPWTSTLNPLGAIDLALNTVVGILGAVQGVPGDGFVEKCSAHLGDVIRDNYNWNHLDEINQLFGITADFETDPVGVFRDHANRLKKAGL